MKFLLLVSLAVGASAAPCSRFCAKSTCNAMSTLDGSTCKWEDGECTGSYVVPPTPDPTPMPPTPDPTPAVCDGAPLESFCGKSIWCGCAWNNDTAKCEGDTKPVMECTSCDDFSMMETVCDGVCSYGCKWTDGKCTGDYKPPTPYVCTDPCTEETQCMKAGVCNDDEECLAEPKAKGTACDDENPNTFYDQCNADGECKGQGNMDCAPYSCDESVCPTTLGCKWEKDQCTGFWASPPTPDPTPMPPTPDPTQIQCSGAPSESLCGTSIWCGCEWADGKCGGTPKPAMECITCEDSFGSSETLCQSMCLYDCSWKDAKCTGTFTPFNPPKPLEPTTDAPTTSAGGSSDGKENVSAAFAVAPQFAGLLALVCALVM